VCKREGGNPVIIKMHHDCAEGARRKGAARSQRVGGLRAVEDAITYSVHTYLALLRLLLLIVLAIVVVVKADRGCGILGNFEPERYKVFLSVVMPKCSNLALSVSMIIA
jgi:hypothetical protein